MALLSLTACGDKTDAATGDEDTVAADDDSAPTASDGGPVFISTVADFSAGDGAGWGQDHFPQNIAGPPDGTGLNKGNADPAQVLSLGEGGSITLDFGANGIVDEPGADFIVFENAFQISAASDETFYELAFVEVSSDAAAWTRFDCDVASEHPFPGCAGVAPVLSNSDNGIAPDDLERAGGDRFDLADIGVAAARYLRITDAATTNGPRGANGNAGFDLDAVVVLHPRP